jgi:hypothetical protein
MTTDAQARRYRELGERTINQLREEWGLPPLESRGTRLHIRSGGSSVDTFVTTDDGQEVEDVIAVKWEVGVDGLATATITLDCVDIDAEGESA